MANTQPLEKIVSEDITKEMVKGINVNEGFYINPKTKYKREIFVDKAVKFFDLAKYYSKLDKDLNDIDTLDDLLGVLRDYLPEVGKDELLAHWKSNPFEAKKNAKDVLSKDALTIAKFIENNRDEVLKKLPAEQLYSLLQRVPLYKTGVEEYDRFRNLRKKVAEIFEAREKGMDLSSVVADEVKELLSKVSEDTRIFFASNDQLMSNLITSYVVNKINEEFQKSFRNEQGKLDREAIKKYLVANYKVVEDRISSTAYEGKDKERERFKIWDKNLKPQYVEIARQLYAPEEKEEKLKIDEAKETREAETEALGLDF